VSGIPYLPAIVFNKQHNESRQMESFFSASKKVIARCCLEDLKNIKSVAAALGGKSHV
jgi:hypothetical protein